MTPLAIAVLSVSLSADAFAAAIGRGAAERPGLSRAVKTGLVFGVIETITPLAGWALGLAASAMVEAVDHWIAFVLLACVGGKMIYEAAQPRSEPEPGRAQKLGLMALAATAVGTSIDAAAVGASLALLGANILVIGLSIGVSTFCFATLGMLLGKVAGVKLGRWAELLGGVALIAIGGKILLEHLGLLA